jgi:hypothetical protein
MAKTCGEADISFSCRLYAPHAWDLTQKEPLATVMFTVMNVPTPVLSVDPRVRGFKGGQNVWAKSMFVASECAIWPSPPAPLPKWERGDSGECLGPPMAVD